MIEDPGVLLKVNWINFLVTPVIMTVLLMLLLPFFSWYSIYEFHKLRRRSKGSVCGSNECLISFAFLLLSIVPIVLVITAILVVGRVIL